MFDHFPGRQPGEDPMFLMGTKAQSPLGKILSVSKRFSLGLRCQGPQLDRLRVYSQSLQLDRRPQL